MTTGGNQVESGEKGRGANGKLSKAVVELREVEKVFPVAKTMIEGLYGAKDAAKEEMEESLRGVRSNAVAARDKAEEAARSVAAMEERAGAIEELAGRIAADSENASARAASAEEAATNAGSAAAALREAFEKVTTTNESKQPVTGIDAIQMAVARTERLPQLVVAGINAVFKGEVTDNESGKKVEMKGADLLKHVIATVETATAAADSAVKEAEEAKTKAGEASGNADEAKAAAGRAEKAAGEAKASATEAKNLLSEFRTVAETLDLKIRMLFGILTGEIDANAEQVVKSIETPVVEEEG